MTRFENVGVFIWEKVWFETSLSHSPESEFYMQTFRNTLFRLHWRIGVKND